MPVPSDSPDVADQASVNALLSQLGALLEAIQRHDPNAGSGDSIHSVLSEHLGQPASSLPVVTDDVPNHRITDVDIALELLASRDPHGRVIGIGGGERRYHGGLSDLAQPTMFGMSMPVGQVDFANVAVGPESERMCVALGIRLFSYAGLPVAVLIRRANPRFNPQSVIEVLCADPAVTSALLDEVHSLSVEHSVLRGQIVTFESSGFEATSNGVTFVARPTLGAGDVILPDGVLDRVV